MIIDQKCDVNIFIIPDAPWNLRDSWEMSISFCQMDLGYLSPI